MALVDNSWYIDFGNGSSTGYYAATAWAATTTKVCGNLVRQLAAPAVGSERIFVCIASVSGTGQTGGSEPAWTLTRGAKTTDNNVTWQEATGIAALNGDLSTATPNWTTVKNTAITLGQVIQNNAGNLVLICTTAGTAGNGAEPSWAAFTNAGATTADNTATWTTLGASFASWAAPHARLSNAYAVNWGQAGNTFWVASEHAETQSTALTISAPSGTASSITTTYCVTKTTVPPVSANLTTGASITTTGAIALQLIGADGYFYGLTLNCGTGSSAAQLTLGNTTTGGATYENCTFALVTTAAGSTFQLAQQSSTILKNCTVSLANVSQYMNCASGCMIQNLTLSGSVPTTLISRVATVTTGLVIKGSDLSTVTGTLVGSVSGGIVLQNCKLAGGVTVSALTGQNAVVDLIRCDSGATNYRNERYRVSGAQTTETTIVRTGGATDGTTPVSWKIVTTAGARWVFPFECQPIAIWNDITGSSKTVTVYGIWGGGAVPNNDDIWIDVEYPGSASFPNSSFSNSTKADNLAAGSSVSSDGSTWGGSTTAFKLTTSFTPQMKGPFNVLVRAAKVSTTFYIDPQVQVT